MTARITRVEIDADGSDFRAEITVSRIPRGFLGPNSPRVEDVPADIREALRDWLGPVTTTEPTP